LVLNIVNPMLKTRRIERKRKLAKYMKKVLKHKHGKA
jgi:hypothetical protein